MDSLGREPQERAPKDEKPRSGDRCRRFRILLSPLWGSPFSRPLYLGLTPQAKYLSPLRGSCMHGCHPSH